MNYTTLFRSIEARASSGTGTDIDSIMDTLNEADLPTTRAVDLYLGTVANPEGIDRIRHYLFLGTQIQRNYSALFFQRRNEWSLINEAFNAGCIDAIQAFAR